MSRLESEVISINESKHYINETIINAVKEVRKKAELRNINILFEPDTNYEVIHDKKWTSEALFNIIENGVKYAKEGTNIEITIIKYEMFLRINIKNYGSFISEEEIPKIFGRFYRGKNHDDIEGIGIGLYLSREILNKQNGYIKVTSNMKYTVFSVFLPYLN